MIISITMELLIKSNIIIVYFKHITHIVVIITSYKCKGYVIIPKPTFSDLVGINNRCCRFDLLLFAILAQSVAALTTVVAVEVVAVTTVRWRSTVTAFTLVNISPF